VAHVVGARISQAAATALTVGYWRAGALPDAAVWAL
jgi:hypothetical protein